MEISVKYKQTIQANLSISGRVLTGFDPAENGGYALIGHFLRSDSVQTGDEIVTRFQSVAGVAAITVGFNSGGNVPDRAACVVSDTDVNHRTDHVVNLIVGSMVLEVKGASSCEVYTSLNTPTGDRLLSLAEIKYPVLINAKVLKPKAANVYYFAGLDTFVKGLIGYQQADTRLSHNNQTSLAKLANVVVELPPSQGDIALDAYELGLMRRSDDMPELPPGWAYAQVVSGVYFIVESEKRRGRKGRFLFMDALASSVKGGFSPELIKFLREQSRQLEGIAMAMAAVADIADTMSDTTIEESHEIEHQTVSV